MRLHSLILAVAVGSVAAFASQGSAAVPAQALHAVVLVDVIPPDQAIGSTALADYARRARREPGVRSVVLIQQASVPNHFILEETFQDQAAYKRFSSAAWVRAFRAALFPHLGSPWDERLGVASQ